MSAFAIVSLLLALVLLPAAAAPADELRDDLKARRARVISQLDPATMMILWSAPAQTYSRDVEYEYRQDSNLLYLTGVEQPETVLVLMPGNRTRREILFVREPNPQREHREGHSLTLQEAVERSGIDTVYHSGQFEPFLTSMFNTRAYDMRPDAASPEYDVFFDAVKGGRAKLAMLLNPKPAPSEPLPPAFEFANRVRQRFLTLGFVDLTPVVESARQVKTTFEQKILRRSVEISSDAHMAGMRETAPGKYEFEVEAAIERVYMANGAMTPGYPSIVGSGPNATILHYNASQRRMEAGDLLLVDAAANYKGQTGDITRTYPVSGVFSEPQKDVYRLVLEAQEAAMKAARAGNKTADIEKASADVVKAGLLKLGLITDATGDQFRVWYTHGICHWIGMDVHDAGDYGRPLEPGMAFVIEPGVYIREAALNNLPDTPEDRAFKEKVRPAVEKYKNVAVRIEDSFLLTDGGLDRLSAKTPRTIEEIERFMRRTPPNAPRP